MFLLPANTPHSPVRFRDTIGVVMEQPRPEGKEDTMRWYCNAKAAAADKGDGGDGGGGDGDGRCGEIVFEKRFICTDLGTQIKAVVEEFAADEKNRTCPKCGTLAAVRYADAEVVQPSRFPEA